MDLPVNELQKMFGKMPINHHSRTIVFENKKTRNILIITGLVILVGGVAIIAYNKGKKRSEEERARLQKKVNEMEAMKKESAQPSYQTKKTVSIDPSAGFLDLRSLQAKKLQPELLKNTKESKVSQNDKDQLKRKDELFVDKKPIAINEDEFKV